MSVTYTDWLTVAFGSARSGQAAGVQALVYDSAGVLQATIGSGGVGSFTEDVAGSGGYRRYAPPQCLLGRVQGRLLDHRLCRTLRCLTDCR